MLERGELGEGSSGSACRSILAITYKKRILKVSDVPEGNTKQSSIVKQFVCVCIQKAKRIYMVYTKRGIIINFIYTKRFI